MPMSAMSLGPDHTPIIAVLGFIGMFVGFLWVRRITGGTDELDRTSWRYQRRPFRGSWLPSMPELPTWGWLLTRGAMAIGLGAVLVATVGPFVLRRWQGAFEVGLPAIVVWLVAVSAAVSGTVWIVRIARHSPEDGAGPTWRYRR
jgi:hypothetical protein